MNTIDSLDPSKATSLRSSNGKEEVPAAGQEEKSMIVASKRDQFLSTYRRQNFALPDSVMYYIVMNPVTPKVYRRLIKTCKYFFIKNPIIVISDAFCDGKEWDIYINGYSQKAINLSKFTSKYWITNEFIVDNVNSQNVLSSIVPKLYQFDAKEIKFANLSITFDEYVYLCSSAKEIYFNNVTVNDKNGDVIALEKLVEAAANVQTFELYSDTTLTNVTSKTAKEIVKNPNFSSLKLLSLNHIPDTFDIEAFYVYMKKNTKTIFDLHFDATISDVYKIRVYAIIDEILETKVFNYKPPLILFPGINFEKFCKLHSIYFRCCDIHFT